MGQLRRIPRGVGVILAGLVVLVVGLALTTHQQPVSHAKVLAAVRQAGLERMLTTSVPPTPKMDTDFPNLGAAKGLHVSWFVMAAGRTNIRTFHTVVAQIVEVSSTGEAARYAGQSLPPAKDGPIHVGHILNLVYTVTGPPALASVAYQRLTASLKAATR